VARYLREREQERNAPEPNHTELLTEQLQKAAKMSKQAYIDANKVKKTKFVLKNKKAQFE